MVPRVSRKGRKGFHAKGAKSFTQMVPRVSRKGRKEFHAMVFLFFACFARSLRALREKKK